MVRGTFVCSMLLLSAGDNWLDSSILLQAKKKAKEHRSPSPPPYTVVEDCTEKDVWLWLGDHKEAANDANKHLWVKQTASQFSSGSTVSYVKTNKHSCNDFCNQTGQVCVRGMDDAHHQSLYASNNLHDDPSRCTLWPAGHDRKSTDEAGCKQKWITQMCACGGTNDLKMDNACKAGGEEDLEQDQTVLFRACEVADTNPNDPFDGTRKADFLLKADPGSDVQVTVNSNGDFEITSAGGADTTITPAFTVEGGPQTGRRLVLPPGFVFSMKPILGANQVFTIVEPSAYQIVHTTPADPILFTFPPRFKVNGNGGSVTIEMSATANLVMDCLDKYTTKKYDNKCEYQHDSRLWRKVNQTLESCYEACASHPSCQYFSFDAVSDRWKGCCMGCTNVSKPQRHSDFTYYEICKRSDVRGQCEQHDEHACKASSVIDDTDVAGVAFLNVSLLSATGEATSEACREACFKDDQCKLFAFDGNNRCQTCLEHHQFQGKGTGSDWAVMGKDCAKEVVAAKFGDVN